MAPTKLQFALPTVAIASSLPSGLSYLDTQGSVACKDVPTPRDQAEWVKLVSQHPRCDAVGHSIPLPSQGLCHSTNVFDTGLLQQELSAISTELKRKWQPDVEEGWQGVSSERKSAPALLASDVAPSSTSDVLGVEVEQTGKKVCFQPELYNTGCRVKGCGTMHKRTELAAHYKEVHGQEIFICLGNGAHPACATTLYIYQSAAQLALHYATEQKILLKAEQIVPKTAAVTKVAIRRGAVMDAQTRMALLNQLEQEEEKRGEREASIYV